MDRRLSERTQRQSSIRIVCSAPSSAALLQYKWLERKTSMKNRELVPDPEQFDKDNIIMDMDNDKNRQKWVAEVSYRKEVRCVFRDEDELYECWSDYKKFCASHPIKKLRYFKGQPYTEIGPRILTHGGFAAYIGMSGGILKGWKKDQDHLRDTIERIENEIFEQKYQHVAHGNINQTLGVRDLELYEHQAITVEAYNTVDEDMNAYLEKLDKMLEDRAEQEKEIEQQNMEVIDVKPEPEKPEEEPSE